MFTLSLVRFVIIVNFSKCNPILLTMQSEYSVHVHLNIKVFYQMKEFWERVGNLKYIYIDTQDLIRHAFLIKFIIFCIYLHINVSPPYEFNSTCQSIHCYNTKIIWLTAIFNKISGDKLIAVLSSLAFKICHYGSSFD